MTKEDRASYQKFHRKTPLSGEQKFTRIFLILGMLFTIIGLFVFEKTYIPPAKIDFRDRLQSIEKQATQLEVDFEEEVQEEIAESVNIGGFSKQGSEDAAAAAAEEAQAKFSSDLERMIGGMGSFSGGTEVGDLSGDLMETTSLGTQFVEGGDSDGFNIADAIGYNPNNSGTGDLLANAGDLGDFTDLSGVSDVGVGLNNAGFENVNVGDLAGEATSYSSTKLTNKAQFDKIAKSYLGVGMRNLKNIDLSKAPELKTEIARIEQQISVFAPQIKKLYLIESMMRDMYGTIFWDILIDKSGKIVAVDYSFNPKGSYFTTKFLEKTKEIILGWHINVEETTEFRFRRTFMK